MGPRAPMPRWHDIPVLWLGMQAVVLVAWVGLVRWLWPEMSDLGEGILIGGALVLIMLVAAMLKRSLTAHEGARQDRPGEPTTR